jgi:hypothetical protein
MNDEEKDAALVRQQTMIAERSNAMMVAQKRVEDLEAENAILREDLGMYDRVIYNSPDEDEEVRISVRGGTVSINWVEMRAVDFLARFDRRLLQAALERGGTDA